MPRPPDVIYLKEKAAAARASAGGEGNMITDKMTAAFQKAQGGLFGDVKKADVGDAVSRLEENGVQLMSWADPFYLGGSYPDHVIEAAVDFLRSGRGTHYIMPIGSPELKVEIARHVKKYNGLDVDPQRNILVTPGSDSGLFFAMTPFIEKDDEVMIIDPSYPNNFQNTEILGGKVVRIPSYEKDNYHPPIEEFEKRLTKKTKMVVLTNPNNPTTTVYRRAWLEELCSFIVKNDLVCVVDQAFEFPVFDGLEMVSAASLPGMWERTLTVCSLSKGMGLSGFRVGYIIADDRIMDKLFGTAVSVIGATNSAAQAGAIAALRHPEFLEAYAKEHLRRRDLVFSLLSGIPGASIRKSESGFLTWLGIAGLGSSDEMADYLMKEAKVAVNSGVPYGENGEGYLRIVHGTLADSSVEEVFTRIREALLKRAKEKGVI